MDRDRQVEYEKRQIKTDLRGTVSDLGEDTALLHYLVLVRTGYGFYSPRGRCSQAYETEVDEKELNSLVHKLRTKLQDRTADPRDEAGRLYDVLSQARGAGLGPRRHQDAHGLPGRRTSIRTRSRASRW